MCRRRRESWHKLGGDTGEENGGDVTVGAVGVGEERGEGVREGFRAKPPVEPKGGGLPILNGNSGYIPEGGKTGGNAFPDRSVEAVRVAKVPIVSPTIEPTEPTGPRGGGV